MKHFSLFATYLRMERCEIAVGDAGGTDQSPVPGRSVICTVLALKSRTPAAENTRSNCSPNPTGRMRLGGRIGLGGNARSLPTTIRKDGTTKRTGSVG